MANNTASMGTIDSKVLYVNADARVKSCSPSIFLMARIKDLIISYNPILRDDLSRLFIRQISYVRNRITLFTNSFILSIIRDFYPKYLQI